MPNDERDDALRWLSAILWPDQGTVIGPADRDRGGAGARTWWASPSAADARILIPADAPAAARRAVHRYHDGFDLQRRLTSLAAEATMAVPGVANALLRGTRVVERPAGAERGPGVLEALAARLDEPDLVVAIGLSVPKSNRKPVLQLLTPTGRCLGWAKIGWSPISERLVSNEARWLERPASESGAGPVGPEPGPGLVVPELLLDEVMAGQRVVVTSGVVAARRPGPRPDVPPAPEVFRAVAARGTLAEVPIVESPWWQSVLSALGSATDEETNAILAAAEAAAGHRFEIGAWHGDLTPWNLMTAGDRVQLIDWELAADGAPIGFDLCHFHTQVGVEMKGLDTTDALGRSARLSPQGLASLGVDARNHTILWRLYLVELARRLLVLRAEGHPTEHVHQGPAALDRLSAMAARHRRFGHHQEAISR